MKCREHCRISNSNRYSEAEFKKTQGTPMMGLEADYISSGTVVAACKGNPRLHTIEHCKNRVVFVLREGVCIIEWRKRLRNAETASQIGGSYARRSDVRCYSCLGDENEVSLMRKSEEFDNYRFDSPQV